jgi:hypothetical protein
MGHNPHLKPWVRPHPNRIAGKGVIERPDRRKHRLADAHPCAHRYETSSATLGGCSVQHDRVRDVVAKLNSSASAAPTGGRGPKRCSKRK